VCVCVCVCVCERERERERERANIPVLCCQLFLCGIPHLPPVDDVIDGWPEIKTKLLTFTQVLVEFQCQFQVFYFKASLFMTFWNCRCTRFYFLLFLTAANSPKNFYSPLPHKIATKIHFCLLICCSRNTYVFRQIYYIKGVVLKVCTVCLFL